MNKIIKLSLVASLACLPLYAGSSNSKLLEKIDQLQNQINILRSKVKETNSKIVKQENTNDELEDRIDSVETSTLTDKINFGVDFRTRVDNFRQKQASGTKGSDNNIWSNRLKLNMSSKITDNMKFVGMLTMYKNWSDSNINPQSNMDSMQGRRPNDSSLFAERAYIDWRIYNGKVPLILTIGRQPSADGPSHQFKDNTVRKSTYSALSFDGTADGVVATFPLNKLTGVDQMALRFGYGKGYQDGTSTNYASYIGNPKGINDTNVMGVFFDSSLGIDGSLMQISAVKAKDVVSNVPNDNKNIGNFYLYTAMLEFTNIKDSGIDLFAHYGISEAKPNGKTSIYYGQNVGLLTSTNGDTSTKSGSAYWIGTRYKLPMPTFKNPYIGFEYNHGSKNWFNFTQGSNDVTNKLATRGDATEVYYIQPINRYAYLRLGAQFIDYKYTGSGWQIGAPISMSNAMPNQLDKLTNIYLLFNVKY